MLAIDDVLANGIRAERSRRRLTQAELAERVSLHPATMSEIERGRRAVTIGDMARVCRALGVPLADLLKGADPDDLQALGL